MSPSISSQFLSSCQSRRQPESNAQRWAVFLPRAWQDAVDAPLYFERHVEYEMSAERVIGYDVDDSPCYTAHHFDLTSLASDDDEDFYEVVTYSEEMAAWRLRDSRWLIFRRIQKLHCKDSSSFYTISTEMPL